MPVVPATLAGRTTRRHRVDRCGRGEISGRTELFAWKRRRISRRGTLRGMSPALLFRVLVPRTGQYSFHDGLTTGHKRHGCQMRDRNV